ncbi:hypothetical protein [Pseudoalteromonas rhizosphaerae]|uniref:Uncharacterized protein n=1 Tax=Pseudoalteromonas rhizosphaerae TaxID=2518973 RepID=A0ABW8KRY0_9GAMM
MLKVFSSIKNDYLIVLTYFIVLVAGYFIGIGSSAFPKVLNTTKDVMSILLPSCGLLMALIGLNNWKKAEKLKAVCKLADELRCKAKDAQKKLAQDFDEFNFHIKKENKLRSDDLLEAADHLRTSNIKSCKILNEQVRVLAELYREYDDELNEIGLKLECDFLNNLNVLTHLKMEIDYKYGTDEYYLKRVQHTSDLFKKCREIHIKMVSLSMASL